VDPKFEARLPWREREFVSLSDAALIVGRSRTWVESEMVAGRLKFRRLPSGGPAVVTVASLRRLVDASEPVRVRDFAEAPTRRLELVVGKP
jgi:hypothetical protein